jgi:hypothetical protein
MKTPNVFFLTESQNNDWGHQKDIFEGIIRNANIVDTLIYSEKYIEVGPEKLRQAIFEIISQKEVDTVVIFMGIICIIDPWFLCKLSNNLGFKTVLIFTDPEHSFYNHDRYYAQCADLSWLFSSPIESSFNIHNFKTFAKQGFYLPMYEPISSVKDIDVSFIGGLYRADRIEYLDFLKKNGIEIFVAGYGSDIGEVDFVEKNKIIARSKIHLNFTKVENKSKKINNRVHQQKGRPIEASLLKTFVLSESYSGLEMLFDSANEIPTFNDKYDLLYKIKYFLANDSEREIAASKAHIKSLSYDTVQVAKEMFQKLSLINHNKKFFISDSDFLELYVGQRYYFFGVFITQGKFVSAYQELKNILCAKFFRFNFISYYFLRGLSHGVKRILKDALI